MVHLLVRTRHIDTVRKAFEHYWAGDVDAVVALYHPEVEIRAPVLMNRPAESLRGLANVRAYLLEMVAAGVNSGVEGLELVEVGGRVVAAGVLAPPVGVRMHWTFELEDGLIRLIKLRDEVWWAGIGGPQHTLGRVAEVPAGGTVVLRVADGRSVEVPIDPELEDKATPQAPVLLYFDAESVAGWYLPDHQEGMVLR